jgi:3-hydroxyacyl-[acyl-carrier-protein] dehydratase
MRFNLIDRITELNEGESITAEKRLSPTEEYLKDHFPRFPVMPGVLMLEAMYQASAWLIRKTENFANAIVLLKEARNVKFQGFVSPGQVLVVSSVIAKQDHETTTLKSKGLIDGNSSVTARLVLERYNLADRFAGYEETDQYTRVELRKTFELLYQESKNPLEQQ